MARSLAGSRVEMTRPSERVIDPPELIVILAAPARQWSGRSLTTESGNLCGRSRRRLRMQTSPASAQSRTSIFRGAICERKSGSKSLP